jgi:hypothetical protein
MPVYILDMLELPAEIKSVFEKGESSNNSSPLVSSTDVSIV